MGVSKITTTTDQRKERRQRRLKAKLCSREAEREKEQTEKADDEEIQIKRQQIIDKLAARLTELEKSKEETEAAGSKPEESPSNSVETTNTIG